MVPVIIIAVVFTGLAVAIFWGAPRGKLAPLTGAMLSQKRGASLAINVVLAVIMIGFGLVVPAIFLVHNHNRTSAGTDGVKLTAAETTGRQLFGEHCAVCHTLAVASAVGKTGPNLDQIKPSVALTLNTLANGCLANPGPGEASQTCLGQGTMPADIVQGKDAEDVAQFVAAVAGK